MPTRATGSSYIEHLNLHNEQKTTYMEISKGLGDSGVERWTVDANKMSMTYYDKAVTRC